MAPSAGLGNVSENYRFYAAKMAELKAHRSANRPLNDQIIELMMFIRTCELRWESRLPAEWLRGEEGHRQS
jgi:hypothetical protein